MREPNIIIWDIETTDFNADKGQLLCVGWKKLGSPKSHCPSVLDYPNASFSKKNGYDDRALLKEAYEILANADMWIHHNGKGFDEKFMNARLLIHGMDPLPQTASVDTYHSILRNGVKLSSRRLGAAALTFKLDHEKTKLSWDRWLEARRGYIPAVREIVKYCKKDVAVTESLYERIKPLCRTHPNFSLMLDKRVCPICGKEGTLHKRGLYIRRAGKDQRYQCQSCGGWSKASIGKKKMGVIQ